MNSSESLYRVKNIDFFLLLGSCETVTEARKRAGICRDHAFNLVKMWKKSKWIVVYEGSYDYTEKGVQLVKSFHDIGWLCGS